MISALMAFFNIAADQPKLRHYSTTIFVGNEIQPYLPFIHNLCLLEYRNYPYLYEESVKGEYCDFLSWYLTSKDGALGIVFADGVPVGFITGTALLDLQEHFVGVPELFTEHGLNAADYYYIGEVIVQREYRGHFLSKDLFSAIEEHARMLGYTKSSLVTESHASHPCKPTNYRDFDGLCLRLGFQKCDVVMPFTWMTIQPGGPSMPQEHRLDFWLKDLSNL